ncbi:MAG TPA: thioester domain-containing protein [Acidimicrobiales bacterium]|nr:thioester domain-containing protein [Acidimicrobiales bacterium]
MITAQRQWRRRAAATVAGAAMGLGLVGALAGPAAAETPTASYKGYYTGYGHPASITGSFGDETARGISAGLFVLDIEGEDEDSLAYCVQFLEEIDNGAVFEELPFDGISNVDKVELILANYYPLGTGPEGFELETDGDPTDEKLMAAATQAAIWHYTDGFDLAPEAWENNPKVITYYETILAAVESGTLEGLGGGKVTLTIEGPEDVDAIPGQLVGPYKITTTAASVELTTTAGLTIHNEDGTPFEGAASDGDEVWLKAAEAGTGTLSGVASGLESGGRVFGGEGIQDLAFAVVTPVTVPASIDLTVGSPPSTPTSSTTSTTKPDVPTTESTVPQSTVVTTGATTTTTPQAGGGLPVTGAQTALLVAVALVLLIVGGAFGIAAKRRSDGGSPPSAA